MRGRVKERESVREGERSRERESKMKIGKDVVSGSSVCV